MRALPCLACHACKPHNANNSQTPKGINAMTRTVFDNHMVAHVWAQQSQPYGKSGNGNFSFRDSLLFSYTTIIARFTRETVGAKRVVLVSSESFSMTTQSKHYPPMW